MVLKCNQCVSFPTCRWVKKRKGTENFCLFIPSKFKLKKIEDIENFLEDHTFICTVFDGRMSHKQCVYQCARSKEKVVEFIKNYFLSNMEEPNKHYQCLHCVRFKEPKSPTIRKLSDRAKRYKNTAAGMASMRVRAYLDARKNLEAKEEE